MGTISTVFLISFWVGLIMILTGAWFGHGHHVAVHTSSSGVGAVPIPLLSLFVFGCIWGGMGYLLLLTTELTGVMVLLISSVTGVLIGSLLTLLYAKLVSRYDNSMSEQEYQLSGKLGTVTIAAEPGRVGEMVYVLHGTVRSAGIRPERQISIAKGEKVIILYMSKGIASVVPFVKED